MSEENDIMRIPRRTWDKIPIRKYADQDCHARKVVQGICDEVSSRINNSAPGVAELDHRPSKHFTTEEPNVKNPYVAQSLLEDVIEELQKRV